MGGRFNPILCGSAFARRGMEPLSGTLVSDFYVASLPDIYIS
jgi:hypothetical protein